MFNSKLRLKCNNILITVWITQQINNSNNKCWICNHNKKNKILWHIKRYCKKHNLFNNKICSYIINSNKILINNSFNKIKSKNNKISQPASIQAKVKIISSKYLNLNSHNSKIPPKIKTLMQFNKIKILNCKYLLYNHLL